MRFDHWGAGARLHLTRFAGLIVVALGLSACANMNGIRSANTKGFFPWMLKQKPMWR